MIGSIANGKCYTLAEMRRLRPQFFKNKPRWTHEKYNVYQNHLIITQTSEEYGTQIKIFRFFDDYPLGPRLRWVDIKGVENVRAARAMIALRLLSEMDWTIQANESSAGLEEKKGKI